MEESQARKYTLSEPLEFGKETITELEFRDAVGADLEDLPLTPKYGDLMDLAARLTNQPPGLIRRLSAEDAMKVALIAGEFEGGGQGTDGK